MEIQRQLKEPVDIDKIHTRPGAGKKFSYISGTDVFSAANNIFGFAGWSSEVKCIEEEFGYAEPDGRWKCCYSALVRITLRDGTFREDIGSHSGFGSRGDIIDQTRKAAVTDAYKRAFRLFGHAFGLDIENVKKRKAPSNSSMRVN